MKIIDLKNETEYKLLPEDMVSCAIGNFDGVHLGHRALITLAAEKKDGITKSAVWTFAEPSSRALGGVSLLTDTAERATLFRSLGIDLLFLADFEEMRSLSPEDFAEDILYRRCQVRRVVCGFNFRYGKMAAGNAETLKSSFDRLGGKTEIVPPFCLNGAVVSSSEIREALSIGNMKRARAMLDRPYSLTAEIVHGKQLGRTLGFPTANQRFPKGRAVPKYGVYAVRLTIDGKTYEGVANVGVRPTVENTLRANCETYVFDFEGNLYGKTATTEFLAFLRPERHFSDVNALTDAVNGDKETAKRYFKTEKERSL
ncbi:MAG: bifunctional riboflavin kinase/FAD synthetase [Clostridia bacterium]|nr:bifunctional riboflavin kinase/FAD synthetase [Clostridia bacterium]